MEANRFKEEDKARCHECASFLAHPSAMAPQPSLAQIRLNNISTCLTLAITALDDLQNVFGTPFIGVISSTTASLITALEVTYSMRNKSDANLKAYATVRRSYETRTGVRN